MIELANRTNYYPDGGTIYGADDFRAPWAALLTPGVINGYAVSADSPADLAVSVAAGIARVGPDGHISRDDVATSVSIGANTSGYNRIDTVVIDVDVVNNVTTIKALQGVPSSSPVAPVAGTYQLVLAQVLVGNNASVINSNVITDARIYSAVNPPAQSTASGSALEAAINGLWTSPAIFACDLQNGWSHYENGFREAFYYKAQNNIVYIDGVICGGTTASGTLLFTLPAGMRPVNTIIRTIATTDSSYASIYLATVYIYADGTVKIGSLGSGNAKNALLNLGDITPFLGDH